MDENSGAGGSVFCIWLQSAREGGRVEAVKGSSPGSRVGEGAGFFDLGPTMVCFPGPECGMRMEGFEKWKRSKMTLSTPALGPGTTGVPSWESHMAGQARQSPVQARITAEV